MEYLIAAAFFVALLGAGYYLTKRRQRPEKDSPPDGYIPRPPDLWDLAKGWFGKKD